MWEELGTKGAFSTNTPLFTSPSNPRSSILCTAVCIDTDRFFSLNVFLGEKLAEIFV